MSVTESQSQLADASTREKFQRLAATWKQETAHFSMSANIVSHPAYQQIIEMGAEAIPLMIQELQREPDDWFWALYSLTGCDPIPVESRGRLNEMAQAWIDWASQHGYTGSMAAVPDQIPVPEWHLQELERRAEELRQNPTAGEPWDTVKERLLRLCQPQINYQNTYLSH